MNKVYISDNEPTGKRCKKWAAKNMPKGFKLTNNKSKCDVFISVGYDEILSPGFIKKRRCFNFHPAELPQYAGVGGCTWSILNGDGWHYITLHEIDEGIDTGDIISKAMLARVLDIHGVSTTLE
jgi:methionyl-tRNA formyltransferase